MLQRPFFLSKIDFMVYRLHEPLSLSARSSEENIRGN